jgi:hypothetical protein
VNASNAFTVPGFHSRVSSLARDIDLSKSFPTHSYTLRLGACANNKYTFMCLKIFRVKRLVIINVTGHRRRLACVRGVEPRRISPFYTRPILFSTHNYALNPIKLVVYYMIYELRFINSNKNKNKNDWEWGEREENKNIVSLGWPNKVHRRYQNICVHIKGVREKGCRYRTHLKVRD